MPGARFCTSLTQRAAASGVSQSSASVTS